MNFILQLFDHWRANGRGGFRRIVVLLIDGLEPAVVDRYLDEGLLHNLALVSDVGLCRRTTKPGRFWLNAISTAARECRLRVDKLLPPSPTLPVDLESICRDDQLQQERLIERLNHRANGVVICAFDMPARLRELFGPQPPEGQQFVLRDMYARMDEIVGKAHSFVDDQTALVVAISLVDACQTTNDVEANSYLFCRPGNAAANQRDVDIVNLLFQ